MKRIPIPTVITAVALVLILLIYMVSFQVRFSEVAVKTRFGRATDASVVTEPGLYFKWPPPIELVKRYDTRYRVLDTPETELLTRDGQALVVGSYAIWRIADPMTYHIGVKTDRRARQALLDRIQNARATVFGGHDLSELFNTDTELVEASFEAVESEMLTAIKDNVLEQFGIEILELAIRRTSLPKEATTTVQEAMRSRLENKAAAFSQGGEARKSAIEARANQQKNTILAFAESKAQEIESAGIKAATRILREIEATDRDFFLWLRWLEALTAGLKERTTIFLDTESETVQRFLDASPELPANQHEQGD